MGTPAAAGPNAGVQFQNITLNPGDSATNYDFGEQGLLPQFALAYFNRRAFLSSTGPDFTGLNLATGPAWVSYDAGIGGN